MIQKKDIFLPILAGLLLVAAFPPIDVYPATWIAFVPLLLALRNKQGKSSFYIGAITGMVYFTGTVYWVFNSMYFYGHIPAPLSAVLMLLLCGYLSLYTGTFSVLFTFISKRRPGVPAVLIAPVLWVTLEFVRTYAFTGFPWSVLGYSQYTFLPVVQIADITGVYGISFLVMAINGAVFDLAVYMKNRAGRGSISRRTAVLSVVSSAALIVLSLFYGIDKLHSDDSGGKIKVSIVQGNIEQDKKWDIKYQREVIDTYRRLTGDAVQNSPDLIVWPETAVPFIFGYDERLSEEITAFQRGLDSYLLFGSVLRHDTNDNANRLSNSALLMSPQGEVLSVYDKIHLVPYGEYVPLREFFPFIDEMVVAVGDFVSGKEPVVMETPFASIGNLVCYEIIFPGLVRKFVHNGANLLVTITNDAWFGRSSAPYQHFAMAVIRAVENRVPVVRAANTGISGFIDSEGRTIDKSPIFEEAVMTEDVYVSDSKSFYAEYGDLFALICTAVTVLLMAMGTISGRKEKA